MLSPIALEALTLLRDCEAESVNAYGLSRLALSGQPGSEWRRTREFEQAIDELAAEGLLWLESGQPRNIPPETWHYRFDRDRCASFLVELERGDGWLERALLVGVRLRLSPLAAR